MSTEQERGVAFSLPFAVRVMRELAGSRRYWSLSGFWIDRMSWFSCDDCEWATRVLVLLYSEPLPIRAGRHTGVPLKESAEEYDILITHCFADLLHRAVIALQHPFGCRDS